MRKLSGFLALALVAGLMAMTARANASETIWVHHGESIQAAIDSAHPGDTIVVLRGVYHESLQIRKNDITLRGHHAVIVPPMNDPNTLCSQLGGAPSGICVLAKDLDPNTGEILVYTRNTRISGFTIRGFPAFGIVTFGARGAVIRHNRAFDNLEYGITSFASTENKFIHNVATGAEEAGFYFGDSPDADAVIRGNRAHDNALGLLIRNASEGVIWGNRFKENCVGTLFIAGEPGPVTHWTYRHNHVWDNDRACGASAEVPFSGVGVLILGAHRIHLVHNRINGNHPQGESLASGGVLVGANEGTPFVPKHNVVTHNVIEHNSPYDIFYDGTGADNVFRHNQCGSSLPPGLC